MCWPAPGPSKTVEFDFDLGADTAMSVASEMVEDLSLSHEDAQARGGPVAHLLLLQWAEAAAQKLGAPLTADTRGR